MNYRKAKQSDAVHGGLGITQELWQSFVLFGLLVVGALRAYGV